MPKPKKLLDAIPGSTTAGRIRATLVNLVAEQQSYLRMLTLMLEERRERSRNNVWFYNGRIGTGGPL